MSYELLEEDDASYSLKDAKGKQIKIAKQALSDALHQKIRGFYKGGEVPASLAPSEDMEQDSFLANALSQPIPQDSAKPAFVSQNAYEKIGSVANQVI